MKKILSIVAGAALVLGSVAGAMAADATTGVVAKGATKVTLDGNIRFRGYIEQKVKQADHAGAGDSASAYDGRVQLGIKAQTSDQVTGYVKLETGDSSGDTYTWGNGTSAGLHSAGSKQAEGATDLSILEAWINYDPGMVGVKAGHMLLALGHKVFFDHTGSGDDALVVYADPSKNTHMGVLAIKFEEGTSTTSSEDDIDGYVALINQKVGAHKLGAHYTYLHRSGGVLKFSNLGVTYDGKLGPVTIEAEGDIQFGDYSATAKAEGKVLRVKASMDMGAITPHILLGYGSGDDAGTADYEGYVNFLNDTIYDTTLITYRNAVPGQSNGAHSRLANVTMLQVGATAKTTCPLTGKKLTALARVTKANLTEDNGNYGEDDLGVEVDGKLTWDLGAGLSYYVEYAYLFSGDAWNKTSTASVDNDNAYWLRHGLNLNF